MQQGSGFVKQPHKEHPGGRVSQVGQTKCITMVMTMIIDDDNVKQLITMCNGFILQSSGTGETSTAWVSDRNCRRWHDMMTFVKSRKKLLMRFMYMFYTILWYFLYSWNRPGDHLWNHGNDVDEMNNLFLDKAFLGLGRLEWLALDKNFLTTLGWY